MPDQSPIIAVRSDLGTLRLVLIHEADDDMRCLLSSTGALSGAWQAVAQPSNTLPAGQERWVHSPNGPPGSSNACEATVVRYVVDTWYERGTQADARNSSEEHEDY